MTGVQTCALPILTTDCAERANDYYHDRLALTVDNSTIDDNYEHYTYNGTYNNAADTHVVDVYNIGTAITLDQEVDLSITNNSHVAGITLTQGMSGKILTTTLSALA